MVNDRQATIPRETEEEAQRSAALLALANRLANAELPPARFRPQAWRVVAAGAGVLVVIVLVLGLSLASNPSSGTSRGVERSTVGTVDPAGSAPGLIPPVTTKSSAGTSVTTAISTVTTNAVATTTATTMRKPAPLPAAGYLVYADGTLTLHGAVATQQMADAELARARAALSPDRVIGTFAVDGRAGLPTGHVIVQSGFAFPRDAKRLPADARAELDRLVAVMKAYPTVTLEVTGHTDSEGSDTYNVKLSTSRAEAVVAYLVSAGVDPSRLTAVGRGESQPVADNSTSDGRAQNRRIDIRTRGL